MRPFFVYGTLLPAQPNVHYWGDAALQFEPATLGNATLFDMGGFPMLIEQAGSHVVGALVTVRPEAYQAILVQLDQLESYDPADPEGSIYLRVERMITLQATGQQRTAWVYSGKAHYVRGKKPFGSDWIAYAAANQASIDAWWQQFDSDPNASLI